MASKHSFRFGLSEFLLIGFVVFSGIMLAFHSGGFVVNFQQVGFTALSSVQKGVSTVASGIGDTFNAVKELARLREENKELTERLKNYEILQRSNTDIKKENERLKEQLGFSLSLQEKNYPAQIISRNPDSLYSAFTINKGSRHGIRKNMPVLAIQGGIVGLVGKVVTVGALTSLVMPIYDSKCSVSARIQNTRDIGLVTGDGSVDSPLNMAYIKKRVLDELQVGDLIVTSGESGNFMGDIPIGSISDIKVLDYDSSLSIKVMPVIDFSRIEMVIVSDLHEKNNK
ncbi:MAG: rod shape-determining protein MreC [Treponema sp.]|jgi:rod shape-determining protein MreC|uniref:rod shape-determining protein MreC n=1 Tax=Treponema sp. TaxID=166 RepID=UPI002A913D15|nr:rod shape-determining protein MreC [Treponema sp.]MDY6397927.1 rod shape-determining protein MreC [Treponema sp.]